MGWNRVRGEFMRHEVFIYEWQHGLLSSFPSALAEAIVRADGKNREKLALGFPTQVLGVICFQEITDWWDALEQRVEEAVKKVEGC